VILALLTYWAFPGGSVQVPTLAVGDIASTEIIAPFDFWVEKSQEEITAEENMLAGAVRPIYEYDADVADSVLARTDAVFAHLSASESVPQLIEVAAANGVTLGQQQAEYLIGNGRLPAFRDAIRRLFRSELTRGVAETDAIDAELHPEVIVRRGGSEGTARRDTLRTRQHVINDRFAMHPDPDSSVADPVYMLFVNELFRPTLVRNTAEYERVQEEQRNSVIVIKDSVKLDERIIDANEPVTRRAADRLSALRARMLEEGLAEGTVGGTVGQVLTNALLLSVFWTLLLLYRPMIYNTLRQMLALTLLFAIVILGSRAGLEVIADLPPELIPVPFAGMVATILFRGRVAMVAAMVLALLIGSQFAGADAVFIPLIGGVAAAVSVRSIRRRNHFLVSAAVVAAAYLLAGFAMELRLEGNWTEMGMIGVRGGLNAVASAALVSTLLPLFESMTRITTDLTLLELSDPDRSLLRRLAIEAPGTYAHSIAMANLCESACNAIGAKGLLARVGCYYHDIGKVKKPQYFVENQSGGANPHDKLKPEVSAGIVRNHVRDGVQLAEEKKLPVVVKDFITEHHGTMEISFFLERAKHKTESRGDVQVEEYRYPGPRPRSVETAVAMLADGVEAAIRVLDDPSPERMRDAIDHIVDQRVQSGQLDDAPLTMAQLSQVKDEFARVIGGTYHNRIDYPEGSGGLSADWEAASDS
jgi:putative nucleotidyltransferase with HDIG domain